MKSNESIIESVQLRNIFSYEEASFEFVKGVTLIEGFNFDDGTPEGSGKSAIPNALCWGLFGKIPKDAKIDDVIREGAESGGVTIQLRNGTKIVRTRKPNDLYYQNLKGIEVRGKDARETQELIEGLLSFSFETFCQAIYFAQNYPAKFISATEAERAKIISEIQDLEAFTLARKKVQALLKAEELALVVVDKEVETQGLLLEQARKQLSDFSIIREAAAREARQKIEALGKQIEEHESDIRKLTEDVERFEPTALANRIAEVSGDLFGLQAQINSIQVALGGTKEAERQRELIRSDLERKTREADRVKAEIAQLRISIDGTDVRKLSGQEAEILNDLEQLAEVRAQTKGQLLSLQDAQRTRARVKLQHTKKLDEVRAQAKIAQEFARSKQKLCPTCGAAMTATHAAKHIEEQQKEAERLIGELEDLKRQLDELGEAKGPEEVEAHLAEIEAGIVSAKSQRTAIETTLRNTELNRRNLDVMCAREHSLDREQAALQARLTTIVVEDPEQLLIQLQEVQTAHDELKTLEKQWQADLLQVRDLGRAVVAKKRELNRLIGLKKDEENRDTSGLDDKIKTLEEEILSREAVLDMAQDEQKRLKVLVARYLTLKDAFQEVKQYVFKGLLSELTKKANKYAIELFEVPVAIKFSNEDGEGEVSKILVTVTLDGSERALGLLSGGQFSRVSLAVDLALSEIISGRSHNPSNLRILDEPFRNLSEVSMERALKLLEGLSGATVLIEHNSMAKAIVNQSVRVELRDGISRITS